MGNFLSLMPNHVFVGWAFIISGVSLAIYKLYLKRSVQQRLPVWRIIVRVRGYSDRRDSYTTLFYFPGWQEWFETPADSASSSSSTKHSHSFDFTFTDMGAVSLPKRDHMYNTPLESLDLS